MVSLNDIEVMMHCHCTPTPHERADAMAVKGAYNMLLAQGMIIPDEKLTDVRIFNYEHTEC